MSLKQRALPFMLFRGGSSKGLFFKPSDLPSDDSERDKVILQAMEGVGMGDLRQIDGLGGATSLTSKVAIVSLSTQDDADLDYLFLQVGIGTGKVSSSQNCGNILAAVLPFAIESGLIVASSPTTTARIYMVNTGGVCEVTVETPDGILNYAGDTRIDGVPGTSAPVICDYLNIAGSSCGALLPTDSVKDRIRDIEVTCIDNGMPEVIIRAADLGISGYESLSQLEENQLLKQKIEKIRLAAGQLMNLGDVSNKTVPKVCLIAPAQKGGLVATRTFIPHTVHEAIGVLGAVSTATACLLPGSVAEGIARIPSQKNFLYSIEHPSGEFTVKLEYSMDQGKIKMGKCGVIRTARCLAKGDIMLPL